MFKWIGTIKSYLGLIVGGVIATLLALLGIQTKRVAKQKEKVEEAKTKTKQAEQKAEIAKVGQEVATESIKSEVKVSQKQKMQQAEIRESTSNEESIQVINAIIDKFNNPNKL